MTPDGKVIPESELAPKVGKRVLIMYRMGDAPISVVGKLSHMPDGRYLITNGLGDTCLYRPAIISCAVIEK